MTTLPTFISLRDSIIADLEAEFSISIPIIGRPFLRILANILAAKMKLQYLQLGKIQKNIAPDQAETESSGGTLERFGRIKLGREPYPAKQGQYLVDIIMRATGTIPAGTTFKTDDGASSPGRLFILDSAFSYTGPINATATIQLRALEAGVESRIIAGDALTVTAPLAIADSEAVFNTEVVTPIAAESIEEYRQKVLQSYRLEPQGGATADYRLWGLDAAGVRQIYPYAKSGAPCEIDVFVEAIISASTDGKGTPTSTILTDVSSVIELDPDTTLSLAERGRRPLGVYAVNVLPIVIVPVDVTITGYIGRTSLTDTTIGDALTELVKNTRPFIDAIDDPSVKNDTLSRNSIISTIMSVLPLSVFTDVTMQVSSVTEINHIFDNGKIPYIRSLTYA